MTQVLADILQIEMFQAPIAGIMEENHDDHYLGVAEGRRTVIRASRSPSFILNGVFFDGGIKKLAEFICHKEYFCNFAFGEHAIVVCFLMF